MMGKLACPCLNIQIDVVNSNLVSSNTDNMGLPNRDILFSQSLAEVELGLAGVHIEQACLAKELCEGDWLIVKCRNCGMMTHATRGNQTLVSLGLLSDSTNIDRQKQSRQFSPAFKVVVSSLDDNSVRSLRAAAPASVQQLEDVLTTFLHRERDAVEQRIHAYAAEERHKFELLKEKSLADKLAILRLLSRPGESGSVSLSGSPQQEIIPTMQDSSQSSANEDFENSSEYSEMSMPNQPSIPLRSESLSTRFSAVNQESVKDVPKKRTTRKPRVHQDSVFSLDGFDDEVPFSDSDADNEAEDDSDEDNQNELSRALSRQMDKQQYSKSQPMNAESWAHRPLRRGRSKGDEEGPLPQDPQSMAASIQALARSVHNGDKDMFGELPRRYSVSVRKT